MGAGLTITLVFNLSKTGLQQKAFKLISELVVQNESISQIQIILFNLRNIKITYIKNLKNTYKTLI